MLSSSSSTALLSLLTGQVEDDRASPYPRAMGPTLVKIADPKGDVEVAVELLDEASGEGRRRNRYLQKSRAPGLQMEEDGAFTYDGRKCCGELVVEINRNLHVIAIPSEYQCTCGAAYRVQTTPREERRHAW
jgi:hypothetical protein